MEAPRSASLRKLKQYTELSLLRICELADDKSEARLRLDYLERLSTATIQIARQLRRELAGDEVPPVFGPSWEGRDFEADVLRLLGELPGTDSNHEGSPLTH